MSTLIHGFKRQRQSTTTGRLLFELGGIPERELDNLTQEAERLDTASLAFAFHMDRQSVEREHGVTYPSPPKDFYTAMCQSSFVAAPDHGDLIKNMIKGPSIMDVALRMVPADGQTRPHSRMIKLMGVQPICLRANNTNCDTAGYIQDRLVEIAIDMQSMLIQVGWKKDFIEDFSEIAKPSSWNVRHRARVWRYISIRCQRVLHRRVSLLFLAAPDHGDPI